MSFPTLRRLGPIVLVVLAVGACSDPVSPDKKVAEIEISPKSARLYTVGQQQQFTTLLTTEAGTEGEGIAVSYVSRNKALLDVTPTGVATAVKKGGSTYVVATAGGKSDSALVEVPTTSCGTLAATPLIQGQVATDIGDAGFCAAASTGDFAVIVHNTSLASTGGVSFEITGTAISSLAGVKASLSQAVTRAAFGKSLHQWRRDVAAEMRLRRQEALTAAPFAASARQWYANRAKRASFDYVPPSVGDVMPLNVNISPTGDPCTNSTPINARVVAVSNSAIVVADPGNPAGGYTDAEYNEFAQAFDSVINPLDIARFGQPTDMDGNGRVLLVFTKAVNERTPPGVEYYIGGLTNTRDLLPRVGTPPCPASNQAEMFYLLVPDSGGAINSNVFTKTFVTSVTEATIAHEYQHLINFARRHYINPGPVTEEVLWLNEGLSHMAEELLYYRKSGKSPRSNIGGSSLSTANNSFSQWLWYASGDFLNYDEYVFAPSITSPFEAGDDLATRGATWAFLRYLADQTLSTDGAIWYNMVNSGETGITNLSNRFGLNSTTLTGKFRDFVVSTYTDDFVSNVATRFTQPSWNMRSIYGPLSQITNQAFTWPLNGTLLSDGEKRTTTIQAGAFKVYRFTGITGADAYIRIKGFGGSTLPAGVTISVVRIQ